MPPDESLPPGFVRYAGEGSGVFAYRVAATHIDVIFVRGGAYRYSLHSVGRANLDEMAGLARAGQGLATFINRVVHDRYERRLW